MKTYNFIKIERGYNDYDTSDRFRAVLIQGSHENAIVDIIETCDLKKLVNIVRKNWSSVEEFVVKTFNQDIAKIKFAKTNSALMKRIHTVLC